MSAERLIAEHFPDGRCVNVSWAILLVLYAGRREERKLDISAVCFAVPAPTTTVLRRIDRFHRLGLIDRVPDRTDGRRTFVVLRPEALGQTEACLHVLARNQPRETGTRS